ncbi:formimidoylglutamate deiminase [Haliangium sp.]|uniref:formimidoylglutamate deiminase n=1 Tax=Haliangium sp. TaxID=2663208 RepID=UPI003D1220F5
MGRVFAKHALLPAGWADDVSIEIAPEGDIVRVDRDSAVAAAEVARGTVIPGMPNLHSHAFQRAMAGLGERAAGADPRGDGDDSAARAREDSFWSWREAMYRFVGRLEPDDVRAIAAQLYLEMVTAGYTAVAEFHYLHHAPDGRPYQTRTAMADAVVDAAAEVGLGLTLLPVLYAAGDFGGRPPSPAQRRFVHDSDGFAGLLAELARRHGGRPQVRVGIAPHSLRAAPPEALARVLADVDALAGELGPEAPIHIHIAEQQREVDGCLAWSGRRPVAWLLDNAAVGARWCLVHATHMDEDEVTALAASGAVAGLCPTTEANLGDGLFPLRAYLDAGGRLGVGSDSHTSISPIEELRWLEYGQRLRAQVRNVAASSDTRSTGARLWRAALVGGAQALARPVGAIAPGQRADLVVLDDDHPALIARRGDLLLDALVFAASTSPVRDVMVGGAWVIRDRQHSAGEAITDRFRRVMRRLSR